MKIAISSGHGKYIRGASGYLDEVDEARKVVDNLVTIFPELETPVVKFHDDVSHSQSENLNRIVNWHNAQSRDLDISVHFNAYKTTQSPMGCEVLYVTQSELAGKVSSAIANAGRFINRGAKYRSDLAFLNGTNKPAILIETCFVDSNADAQLYLTHFEEICSAIAEAVTGKLLDEKPDTPGEVPPVFPKWRTSGKVSWFGGPEDEGVAPDEGLAFIYEYSAAPQLFLPYQPEGTTGLARRLDPEVFYIAQRWDYNTYPKEMLASGKHLAKVRAPKTGKEFLARPADWGPNETTGRVCDVSQGLLDTLGITTDDTVEVEFPASAQAPEIPAVDTPPVVTVTLESDKPVRIDIVPGNNVTLE